MWGSGRRVRGFSGVPSPCRAWLVFTCPRLCSVTYNKLWVATATLRHPVSCEMSSTLAPPGTSTPNSPGSSVFDLPTQPANYARPTVPNASIPLQAYRRLSSQTITDNLPKREPSYVVVSGGTGCNSIVSAFGTECCYVLPVSDDGGSSSEIIRVLGGPSIGMCLVSRRPCAPLTRRRGRTLSPHSLDPPRRSWLTRREYPYVAFAQVSCQCYGTGSTRSLE